MTVTLQPSPDRQVAVLHGVDSDAALAHLCRSLVAGSVFDSYRALVIDGGAQVATSKELMVQAIADATLSRGQLVSVAPTRDLNPAVRRARRWLRLLDSAPTDGRRRALLGAQVSLAAAGFDVVSSLLSGAARLIRGRR